MKKIDPTLQMLFLVLLFAQIPQTFQEQVETKAVEAPDVELPQSKETSVDFRKPVSAKMASEQKIDFLPVDRIPDGRITIDKSYSNAATSESSALDGAVNPVVDEPTKTLEDAKILDALALSWTEASGRMSTNERPVENFRPRGSYSSGRSSDDDDDDGEEDGASGVSVIVVVVGVGVVALLAILVLTIWWCRKRRIAQQPGVVRYRYASPKAPPEVPAGDANEEALLDDTTQK